MEILRDVVAAVRLVEFGTAMLRDPFVEDLANPYLVLPEDMLRLVLLLQYSGGFLRQRSV